jgi:hypothetical protein
MIMEPEQYDAGPTPRVKAILVDRGKAQVINLPSNEDERWDRMQGIVGNIVESCFKLPVEGGLLVGYCDEEFLLRSPEEVWKNWNVALGPGLRGDGPYPIGGPIIVVRETRQREAQPLRDEDVDLLWLDENEALRLHHNNKVDTKVLRILDRRP